MTKYKFMGSNIHSETQQKILRGFSQDLSQIDIKAECHYIVNDGCWILHVKYLG